MSDEEVQFGPFLPGQEAQEEEENVEVPPPPPPLLYPRGVCAAAWDKARLQLALLLSRAAADVGAAPSTTAAAIAAFHLSLSSFFHIDPTAVSSSLSASLFLSAKAADEEFNLRRVIASLGFCSHHASAAAEERRRQQQQQLKQQQQQFAGEYVALGIKEYWRQRQSCFLEEQRLMQALGFTFPNPTIWQQLPLALLLSRPAAAEAAITAALVADAAVGPLVAETEERVLLVAACLLARKLVWRFRDRNKQQQQQQQQQQWLFPPASVAIAAAAATPDHKAAAAETVQLLEDEINATAGALRPGESDTRSVLLRLLPLLQGISSSIDQCSNSSSKSSRGPLCRQLAAAAKKMLLQYALLLDDSHGHQVYRRLTGVEA
ncbi:hypothetical protein, conserved [Eimeria praecox]|uniref:Uncharacterized protein n=1 Tax=Eimeria praecox TaxID=51316 RepID=U6H7A3_9EIME|nr:hypothetical protein, conserved [Eimeria praecox]